jgi:hypothetical protein
LLNQDLDPEPEPDPDPSKTELSKKISFPNFFEIKSNLSQIKSKIPVLFIKIFSKSS